MVTLQPPTSLSKAHHMRSPTSKIDDNAPTGPSKPNSPKDHANRPMTSNQQQKDNNNKLLEHEGAGGHNKTLHADNQSSKTQAVLPETGEAKIGNRHGSNLQEKSYTQNISEGSREDTMILRPQNILNDTKGTLDLQLGQTP